MRRLARWFMVLVLVLDAVVVTVLLTGGTTQIFAQQAPKANSEQPAAFEPSAASESAADESTRWTKDALQLLGNALAARSEELDRRQLEVEELARSVETLKRAGIDQEAPSAGAENEGNTPGLPPGSQQAGAHRQELFTRLSKTYENMEPASAAAALSKLALLDKGAVVELILGWKPRVAGAVLDELTLSDPALAADLSYGIWLLSGKNGSAAATAP